MPPTAHPSPVSLLSVGTAVPPHVITQDEAARLAHRAFGARFGEFARLSRVFETSGILRRQAVRPAEWYMAPLGWTERNQAYIQGAGNLFVEAATAALSAAGIAADRVDAVVTVSSTGIATPSLESREAVRLGLRADIERVPVFGLGCAGGVSGLSIAADLAAARPGRIVLMVAVETCTLSFRMDTLTKANIVATALFGDGAAAAVLCAGGAPGPGPAVAEVTFSGRHMWPDTLDIMGWNVDPEGLGVIFDRSIPPFVQERVAPALDAILAREDMTRADVDRFACHPGGAKVVEALESTLALTPGTLGIERDVLRDHGNMSAPTVLFVLDRLIRAGLPARTVVTAMGPGFTLGVLGLKATGA